MTDLGSNYGHMLSYSSAEFAIWQREKLGICHSNSVRLLPKGRKNSHS